MSEAEVLMPQLSDMAEEVRRNDRDRFLCTLFAPEAAREGLFALYAFNLEIAKTREAVSETMLGLMRLTWWREAVEDLFEGHVRRHVVLEALAPLAQQKIISREALIRLIDVREADVAGEAPPDIKALEFYAESSSSVLLEQALSVLEAEDENTRALAYHLGIAYALVGLLRSARIHFMQGKVFFPQELMHQHHLTLDHFGGVEFLENSRKVVEPMTVLAREHLHEARMVRKNLPAAVRRKAQHVLLFGTLAETYLRRIEKAKYDVFATDLEQGRLGLQLRMLKEAWFF